MLYIFVALSIMKALTVIFFCSWKFAATFPVAIYIMKMSAAETLLYSNLGGAIGTLVSVYFSDLIIKLWDSHMPEKLKFRKKKRKVFTPGNRRFITLKSKYGLFGIVALSPVLLSIPLGSFLTVKYYGLKSSNISWLIVGQVFWSVVYILFYTQIKALFV